MPLFAQQQIAEIVKHLPKRLVLAMFIHNRFTNVEIADLDLFYVPTKVLRLFNTSAQDTPEWLEIIEMLSDKDGLYRFMLSDASDAQAVWNALIERDFSPRAHTLYNIDVAFNEFRTKYISSAAYLNTKPNERYHEFSILDDIHHYLVFSERREHYVGELSGLGVRDKILFERHGINNVANLSRRALLDNLLARDDLKAQWAHTLKLIIRPQVRTSMRLTFLMQSALHGDESMVAILLARGVDINLRHQPRGNATAISIALEFGHFNVANLLLASNTHLMPVKQNLARFAEVLASALKYQRTAIIRYMLRHQIPVNYRGECMQTPLMYAAMIGGLDIIERLIALGADVNMYDAFGYKASDYARHNKHIQALNFLRQKENITAPPVGAQLHFTAPETRGGTQGQVGQQPATAANQSHHQLNNLVIQ